eukprot:9479539-Pyramimonas_sp.AAC.1
MAGGPPPRAIRRRATCELHSHNAMAEGAYPDGTGGMVIPRAGWAAPQLWQSQTVWTHSSPMSTMCPSWQLNRAGEDPVLHQQYILARRMLRRRCLRIHH